MDDPLVIALIAACTGLIVFAVVVRVVRGRREARYWAHRRDEVRERRSWAYMQQQEIDRLALQIVATSSTAAAPGYRVARQIEAIVTDGHVSPLRAIETLKAVAAQRGANGVINLATERAPTGKYLARGDAVTLHVET
jgi:hypothetical protein